MDVIARSVPKSGPTKDFIQVPLFHLGCTVTGKELDQIYGCGIIWHRCGTDVVLIWHYMAWM